MSTKKKVMTMVLTAMMFLLMMQTTTFAAVKLNKKNATVTAGKTVTLKVNTKKSVTWKSSNKKVATVSKTGKVTGVKAGKATIKAKVKGSKTILSCKVTVKAAKKAPAATANTKVAAAKETVANNSGSAKTAEASETKEETTKQTTTKQTTTKQTTTKQYSSESKSMTAEESKVYHILLSMKDDYPEGKHYTNEDFYYWKGGIYLGGYGCAAFAMLMSDAAFGDVPARKHTNFDNMRVGDIIRVDNNTHCVIVLKNNGNSITVAEGNYNSKIHWGRVIPLSEIKKTGSYVMTRYED